jgi:hypothetical protein
MPKIRLRVLPVWALKDLFRNPKALLAFATPSAQKLGDTQSRVNFFTWSNSAHYCRLSNH